MVGDWWSTSWEVAGICTRLTGSGTKGPGWYVIEGSSFGEMSLDDKGSVDQEN